MTLRSAWPRFSAALLATAAIYSSSGCSFFYDLNTTQCEVTADCLAFGQQFANTTCVNRVCVPKSGSETGGTSSNGGSENGSGGSPKGGSGNGNGGGGNTSTAGSGGKQGAGGVIGQGGDVGVGADAGMGGAGGGDSPPECTTNTECIEAHQDRPYICRDEKCVALTNPACPIVVPITGHIEILEDDTPPIVLGGYASMTNKNDLKDTYAVINWDLAFTEFATALGVGSTQPRMVGVICQGLAGSFDVDASMTHLAQELGTPGILSTLAPDDLDAAWKFTQTAGYMADYRPVFFMSTGSADLRLANLKDGGLVWHQLGDPRGLAATTASLLKHIEPHVRALRTSYYNAHMTDPGVEDPATVPLRVTLVHADHPTMIDVASVLTAIDDEHPENMLAFNGATAIDSSNMDNFRQVTIESGTVHTNPPAVITNGVVELQGHPPHIIVGMGTSEFPQLMSAVEATWGAPNSATAGKPRPFYVLSHLIRTTASLPTPMESNKTTTPPLNQRTVGVSYALAQDAHSKALYDSYLAALNLHYDGDLNVSSTENHYDGAYGLLYAVVAAAPFFPDMDGTNISTAWQSRVIYPSGTLVDIGPSKIADTAGRLGSNLRMLLWGTMGKSDFDGVSGTRNSATSAWCTQYKSGSTSVWEVQIDALLYNAAAKTFSSAAALPTCMQDY